MARSLNGSTDSLKTATGIGVHGLAAFTVAAWALHRSGTYMIEIPFDVTGSNGLDIRHDGTGMRAGLKTSAAAWAETTVAVVTDSNWHHWAATFDNTDAASVGLELWKDGVSSSAKIMTNGVTVSATADELDLGTFGTFGSFWGGQLAEVAIWDVRLSSANLLALTNKTSTVSQILPGNLIGYWPVCGLNSPEQDYKGSHNLTVTGTNPVTHPSTGACNPIITNVKNGRTRKQRMGWAASSPGTFF